MTSQGSFRHQNLSKKHTARDSNSIDIFGNCVGTIPKIVRPRLFEGQPNVGPLLCIELGAARHIVQVHFIWSPPLYALQKYERGAFLFWRLATQGVANGSQIAQKGARFRSNVYENTRFPKGILGWCSAAKTIPTHKYRILETCNDIRNLTTEATRSEPMWSSDGRTETERESREKLLNLRVERCFDSHKTEKVAHTRFNETRLQGDAERA